MPSSPASGYWLRRQRALLEQMERDEARLNARLAKVYETEAARLGRDIAAYYAEYGEGAVIEYRTLLQSLSDADRRLLMERMDDFAAKHPQWAHLLPVRETVYMLDRLEAMQTAIRIQQLEVGAIERQELDAHFKEQARRAANLAAEALGFGSDFYAINAPVVKATVGAAWAKGESYSERIWDNREKLAAYLNDDFAKAVARGDGHKRIAADLCERFVGVSVRDARRLAFTEGTFLLNEAQRQVFAADFDECRIVCADSRACPVCKALEEKQEGDPIRLDEARPGVNFPPLHPWCRCSHVPAVADWDEWIDGYVARHGGDAVTPPIAKAAKGGGL